MSKRFQLLCTFGGIVLLLSISVQAAPVIKVENNTYECGQFTEKNLGTTTATFIFQNIGDSLLKIESVRPGCGCVVAAYDTFISPGKTGRVQLTMNLKGYSGQISKSATVHTNTKNEPSIRISMHANILQYVAISAMYISCGGINTQPPTALFLTSLKKDLKITDITFKADNNSSSWQHQLSIPVVYDWSSTDSITTEGYNVFKLTISPPELKESISGDFIISTNHPEKSVIQISGRIGER